MAWDRKRVSGLLKSISEELAAEVEIAEKTGWNEKEIRYLRESLSEEVGPEADISMVPGGPSVETEARARMAEFRKGWFRVGTCTDPADRPRAEAAISRMYAALGAASPRFVWCDSPMAAQQAVFALGGRRSSRRTALWRSLSPALRDALGDAEPALPLGLSLGDALRASRAWLHDALRAARKDWLNVALRGTLPTLWVRAVLAVALEDPRWGSGRARELLEAAVESALVRSLRALKLPYHRTPLRGQQEADWIELLLFDRDVLGIGFSPPLSERLDSWADLARSCMWWWPYRGICLVSERPAGINSPDGRLLHHEGGPAVRFRDNWSIWVIGGVVVDEQIVLHPDTQTIQQIRREGNTEVKRIRIERYGWDRYLAQVGAVAIDSRRNDVEATRETLMRTPDGESVLVCACPSTARVYALEVPRSVQTCERAQAWLSGGLAGRIINAG